MQQPGVTSPIIGPRTMEQFEDNLGALDVTFTDDDQKRIDHVARRGDAVAPSTRRTSARTPTRI